MTGCYEELPTELCHFLWTVLKEGQHPLHHVGCILVHLCRKCNQKVGLHWEAESPLAEQGA